MYRSPFFRAASAAGAAALLVAAGCLDAGGLRQNESLTMAVDTIAGVEHVRTNGEPPQWSLEHVVTIGSVDDGPAAFGRVVSVLADSEGAVYVADALAGEIRVFDQSGRHLRTIGRKGRGPGEFTSLYALAWLGDTIAALDPGNARIELLSRDGSQVGSFRHQPITGPEETLHRASQHEFLARIVQRGERGLDSYFVRYTGASAADTIPAPPRVQLPGAGIQCEGEEMIAFFSQPFGSRQVHTFVEGGRLVGGMTAEYRLALVARNGDTLRVIERQRPPVPITDAEWNDGLASYREFRERAPGARCEPASFSRPAAKAPWTALFVGGDGRLWVRATTRDGSVFEVFEQAGRLVGMVAVPERMRDTTPYFGNGMLYVVEADSLDVQSVSAYRVGER